MVTELEHRSSRRIKVHTLTRAVTTSGEREVVVLALSARSALVLAKDRLGHSGDTVDLVLPTLGGQELPITAGIERTERLAEGHVYTVEFMMVEQRVRRALDELLALLLGGDGGGTRQHPRIVHDVPVTYGEQGQDRADLEEVSMSGLSMRTHARIAEGSHLEVQIPDARGGVRLNVRGRVVNTRPATVGFHVGLAFGTLDPDNRTRLAELLSELVRR